MKQAVFLCREEGLGGKKNSFSSVCEEACKIDEPYMWNVIWCWKGRSKSAEGGFMEGGPLEDLEVQVMGSYVQGEERPGAGKKKYCG